MSTISVSADAIVPASSDRVFKILADYRHHHPQILPPAFSQLQVESGGYGDGTVISFQMKLGGRTTDFRQTVTEPEPGRKLTETDHATGATTSFIVLPESESESRVTIETTFPRSAGFKGYMEQWFAPRMFKKIYAEELFRLGDYAQTANL
jgi:hypothetical protein